jgi:hypothetical protein
MTKMQEQSCNRKCPFQKPSAVLKLLLPRRLALQLENSKLRKLGLITSSGIFNLLLNFGSCCGDWEGMNGEPGEVVLKKNG